MNLRAIVERRFVGSLAALVAGMLLSLSFAPFGWWPMAILMPAALIWLWEGATPRRGETLQLDDCEIKVMRFDRRRIDTLRLTAPRDIVPPEDRPLVEE